MGRFLRVYHKLFQDEGVPPPKKNKMAIPRDPMAIPRDPMAIPRDPMAIPRDPMAIPRDPMAIPRDPMAIPRDPMAIPRDPITETENGFMEPKYYAFRRWLDIPCSSSENINGCLGNGKYIVFFIGHSQSIVHYQTKNLKSLWIQFAPDTPEMFPENWWLEDDSSFTMVPFQGKC